jgi:fructose-bisphosphate aldolase class II
VKTLRQCITDAVQKKVAIGHFNFSNLEMLRGIFGAAYAEKQPVVVGLSEGERDFLGVSQAAAIVRSLREQYDFPIFLNADHTYSLERVREVTDAGYDSVVVDGSALPFAENISLTKAAVLYARKVRPEMLVEGELGFIGKSSKVLDELPPGFSPGEEFQTGPEEAARFVKETGVDFLAPSVGSIHGVFSDGANNFVCRLNIPRIRQLKSAVQTPLVLHGGSGQKDEEFRAAVQNGISIVHFSTDLRIAYRKALIHSLEENPDEIAPYKYLKPAVAAIQAAVSDKIRLLAGN